MPNKWIVAGLMALAFGAGVSLMAGVRRGAGVLASTPQFTTSNRHRGRSQPTAPRVPWLDTVCVADWGQSYVGQGSAF